MPKKVVASVMFMNCNGNTIDPAIFINW